MNVYTTLLATDNYVDAVLTLAYSLQQVNSYYPLVVICYDSLSKETFQKLDDDNIQYQVFPSMMFSGTSRHDTRNYDCTMGKFLSYKLKDVKRFVFIDADSVVLQNIDWMFQVPYPIFFYLDESIPTDGLTEIPPIHWPTLVDNVSGCLFSDFTGEDKFNFAASKQELYGEDEQILIEMSRCYQHLRVDLRHFNWVYNVVVYHESAYGVEYKFWLRDDFKGREDFYRRIQSWRENNYTFMK